MTSSRCEPILHGWDETGQDWCVSDYPDLLGRLMEICGGDFADGDPHRPR